MAKQTFMSRVKAYRKLHPRCSQVDAMKKLKGTSIGATKKKKAPVAKMRKAVAATKRKIAIGSRPKKIGAKKHTATKRHHSGKIGSISRAEKLIKDIDKLEAKRKQVKHRELRDIVQLEINNKHDQLKAIKSACRRKSA